MTDHLTGFDRIRDRAGRLIKAEFERRQRVLRDNISTILRQKRLARMHDSSKANEAVFAACDEEINEKATIVWNNVQRAYEAGDAPITETLATDLKEEVSRHIETAVEDARKLVAARQSALAQPNSVLADLESIKRQVQERFDVEVDLYVDSIRGQNKRTCNRDKTKPARDQVFICYSRKDKRWHDDLQTHLAPYVRNGSMTAWSDEQIAPSSKWFPEIKLALAHTKVAVLLVTPNFLASDFIHEHELTPLLKEAGKDNVRIIWLPVRACSYEETPLKDYQAAIDPKKPLANVRKADRDKAWVKVCKEIKRAVSS